MKNMIKMLSIKGLAKGKFVATFLLAFFLFTVQSNAQQYVNESQAINLLDSEITAMNDQLASLQGDANYPQFAQLSREIGFYTGVKRQLTQTTATVSQAVTNNYNNFINAPTGFFPPSEAESLNQEVVDLLTY